MSSLYIPENATKELPAKTGNFSVLNSALDVAVKRPIQREKGTPNFVDWAPSLNVTSRERNLE